MRSACIVEAAEHTQQKTDRSARRLPTKAAWNHPGPRQPRNSPEEPRRHRSSTKVLEAVQVAHSSRGSVKIRKKAALKEPRSSPETAQEQPKNIPGPIQEKTRANAGIFRCSPQLANCSKQGQEAAYKRGVQALKYSRRIRCHRIGSRMLGSMCSTHGLGRRLGSPGQRTRAERQPST